MRVVLEGKASNEVPVISGGLQGTVLGPLLLLCHNNYPPNHVQSQVRLFADDCFIYHEIKLLRDHHIMQNNLITLESRACVWVMHFNAKKCYVLSVKHKSQHYYTLDNTILQCVSSNPYLGIEFSGDMKWSTHISIITSKACSTIGLLHRNLWHCLIFCQRNAYLSLVRSIVEYGTVIWDP